MENVCSLTAAEFEKTIEENSLCLIDFWASWCGPCKMLAPVIEEIAGERSDVKVCKVNIDDEQDLASRFRIMSIPTVLLFKDGSNVDKLVGAMPKQEYLNMIDRYSN